MSHKIPKQFTLRGIPENIFHEFQSEAMRNHHSLNSVLLRRLLPGLGKKKEGACSVLLTLSGTWDTKISRDFSPKMNRHRRVDSELWS